MKSTKVECQEIHANGPQVEEIASYTYTIVEDDNSLKPINGMVIEEFSETDDNKAKLSVNRGISIVSVSDDESTMKALSRDVSTDDILAGDLNDSSLKFNGTIEEIIKCENGRTIQTKVIEDIGPYHAMRYSETIMEECKVEEQFPENIELMNSKPQTPLIEESKIIRKQSKICRDESMEEQRVKVKDVDDAPKIAEVGESKLTRQSSKLGTFEETQAIKTEVIEVNKTVPQSPSVGESGLSRQSSRVSRVDSTESRKASISEISRQNSQQGVLNNYDDEEVDEKTKSLFERIKTQRSVLEEILDKEADKAENGEIGGEMRNIIKLELTLMLTLVCKCFYCPLLFQFSFIYDSFI